jgi:hypothetical protein
MVNEPSGLIKGGESLEYLIDYYNEVFSGNQPCENGVTIQRFGDSLCLHHEH